MRAVIIELIKDVDLQGHQFKAGGQWEAIRYRDFFLGKKKYIVLTTWGCFPIAEWEAREIK